MRFRILVHLSRQLGQLYDMHDYVMLGTHHLTRSPRRQRATVVVPELLQHCVFTNLLNLHYKGYSTTTKK